MAITFPAFSSLRNKVIHQLSLVPGSSVQTYAEDIISSYLQSAFDEVFDLYFWPNYSQRLTVTLDGTVGIPNADIDTYVKRIEDIGVMFIGDSDTQVKALNKQTNPNTVTGTVPKFYEPYLTDPDRVFRVYPAASTGDLDLYVRTKPDEFVDADTIKIDQWIIIFKAVWFMLEQDAANPGQAQLFQKRFDDRLSLVLGNIINSQPVPIDPAAGVGVPSEWQ